MLGTYGLSLLTVAVAGLSAPLFLATPSGRRLAVAAPLLFALAVLGVGGWRLWTAPSLPDTGIQLRIVQAGIAQHHKWDPQKRAAWFRRHLDLSALPRDPPAQVVIWPESAVPYDVEVQPEVREYLAKVTPQHGAIIVGGDRYDFDADPQIAHNSLFVLDDARHVLRPLRQGRSGARSASSCRFAACSAISGLRKLTQGSIDFSPGPGRVTLPLPNLPAASPLICYEAAFPGKATAPGARPAWLVNITNDAWFGRSSGPYQHLAMARMRAVEEGLPLVRAANTGISVVTDAYGRDRSPPGAQPVRRARRACCRHPCRKPHRRAGSARGCLSSCSACIGALSVLVEWRAARSSNRRPA